MSLAPPCLNSADSPARLGYWRFNAPEFAGEGGRAPIAVRNVTSVPSFDGAAAEFSPTNQPVRLLYPVQDRRLGANLDVRRGSIRFLIRPRWASRSVRQMPGFGWGQGPGDWVRLFEAGPSNASALPVLALSIDPLGTNLVFQAMDASGQLRTNLQTRIVWTHFQQYSNERTPGKWHEVMLAWSPEGCYLVVDGRMLKDWSTDRPTGPGISFTPALANRAEVFSLGSGRSGRSPAGGAIDEVETFNYPVSPLDSYTFLERTALSASVSASPMAVNLSWYSATGKPVQVMRRRRGATEWTTRASQLAGMSYTDRDPALEAGRVYEYKVGARAIVVPLEAAPVESRGKVIVLVDETVESRLSKSLETLHFDLAGDGWRVVRHQVPRHDDNAWNRQPINPAYAKRVAAVKQVIEREYATAPAETKAVYIIGHAVIPYSGISYEDGHFNHNGAWPADAYYGDVDGIWSDSVMNSGEKIRHPARRNLPGDGKLDPYQFRQYIGSRGGGGFNGLELAVGRIDFYQMPAFEPANEIALLRRYLDKAHRYRHKELTFQHDAIAGSHFENAFASQGKPIYDTANLLASRLFGPGRNRVTHGDAFAVVESYRWGLQGGYGSPDGIHGRLKFGQGGGTRKIDGAFLAARGHEPKIGFHVLKGSYFGDWNMTPNNFMRTVLAGPDHGLGAVWTRHEVWHFEDAGAGAPIARAAIRSATPRASTRTTYWLGDPTLRDRVTAPPARGRVRRRGRHVTLTWSPSLDANSGYAIFRSPAGLDGPFKRLNEQAILNTQFVDTDARAGAKLYQIRALEKVTTGSGTYTNLSQALFVATR